MTENSTPPGEITQLLRAWGEGRTEAFEDALPLLYSELKRLARAKLGRERPGHTLQPTALVNELYLRFAKQREPSWESRDHFLAVAGSIMRWILVDHARQKRAAKRGAGISAIAIDERVIELLAGRGGEAETVDVIALDEALLELAELEPRQSRIVELRYFAGLTIEETAQMLEISPSLVKKDWRMARAWLRQQLGRAGSTSPDGA